jgi:predicted nucleotidyltransferase
MMAGGAFMSTQVNLSISFTPVTDDLLQDIVQRVVATFDPETIILFGSRAYGEPDQDSDIDLLVVTEALHTWSVFERHRAVSDLFPHRRFALDVIVRTPDELSQLLAQGHTFFREIITQGKVLYERRSHRLDTKSRSGLSERTHPAAPAQDLSAG